MAKAPIRQKKNGLLEKYNRQNDKQVQLDPYLTNRGHYKRLKDTQTLTNRELIAVDNRCEHLGPVQTLL